MRGSIQIILQVEATLVVRLLDGGMGSELIARGAAQRGGLWSAQALLDAPNVVEELHREYVAAGADVVTTNTYSAVPSYLDKAGLGHRQAELVALAGELARAAVAETETLVAGSLPPLSESYRADLAPAERTAAPVYRTLARALAPHVDVFLCETMSSIREARNAVVAATEASCNSRRQPIYVSFTLDDVPGQGLRSGESLHEAIGALADLPITSVLVNCSRPESIVRALEQLGSITDLPLGCYANRMELVPDGWTLDNDITIAYRDDLSTAVFAEWGRRCVAAGATMVGGCCGVGPSDIAALRATLRSASALG